jgi:heme/copper-type cytochrome/quinol oxidase subunit 2
MIMRIRFCTFAWTLAVLLAASIQPAWAKARVINVLADKDSHFKIPGQKEKQITVKAGEPIVLTIEARKGKTWSRDGAVHGFTLLRAKDHATVPGWDLELKPGTQTFTLTAPSEAGEYEVVCTVICSDNHEGMRMKFMVVP